MKVKTLTANTLLALALTALTAAHASPVTYEFLGTVNSDTAERGWAAFTGNFTFDSASTDGIADASTAAYAHSGAPWGMRVSFDGGTELLLDSSFNVLVSNDLGGSDQWGLLAQKGGDAFSLSLFDLSASLFGSDALPLNGLTLADFDFSNFLYEADGGELQGQLDDLYCSAGCSGAVTPPGTPVPEPGSVALVATGLATLVARRRMQGSAARQSLSK